MNLTQIHAWLNAHTNVIKHACTSNIEDQLNSLNKLIITKPRMPLKDFVGIIKGISLPRSTEHTLEKSCESIALMIATTEGIGKAAACQELRAFGAALSQHKYCSVVAFFSAVESALTERDQPARRRATVTGIDPTEINAYVRQLETALGDEAGFKEAFQTLSNDPRLKAPDAKLIAKRFAGKAGKNKSEALGLIMERQSSLLGSRARAGATAGRSAA